MRVAVFCSASTRIPQIYSDYCEEFCNLIKDNGHSVIYGGANCGLMGTIAQKLIEHQIHITGVIPKVLSDRELFMQGLDELLIVESMHERKQKIYELCDLAVALPGGFGTLDEAFEFMTWNQIGLHQKKFAFLNWNNYYDEIQKFTFKAKEECFTHTYDNFNANFFNSNQEFFQWIS